MNIDKCIKMLLIKLSPRYKISIITIMSYNDEAQRFSNIIKLRIQNRFDISDVHTSEHHGKRELVGELMKWLGN